MALNNKIFWREQHRIEHVSDKVSIIGSGMVGMAIAVSLLGTGVTKNLVLVDTYGPKVQGEVLDLQHAALFLKHPKINGGSNFSATAGSKLCIITAGVRQEPGESRFALAQRNADIVAKIVPECVKYSPDTLILMVGNPCDVLTYIAWKVSGLPSNKVLGAGTVLDTQRFRLALARKFNVNPGNVHAWIIGEHGDNSIALWSTVNIGGIRIQSVNPKFGTDEDTEKWLDIHKDVIGSAQAIQELKGYTNWGVGMSVAAMSQALLSNKFSIFPVSVNARGKFGISDDIYIPLPTVLGSNGVLDVVHLNLNEKEINDLQNTASFLKQVQDSVQIKEKEVKCKCRRCK